jgi:alkylation response protein AidB-like acyl-CoA dehydrogenase
VSFRQLLDDVIEDIIAPGAAEVDRTGHFPRRQIEALGAAGLLALTVPAEYGGGGKGLRAAAEVARELGAACSSTAMVMTMHYSATAALVAGGHEKVLTAIATGRHLSTLALSEVGSRSHFWAPVSRAEHSGDGVKLDAAKSWVTAAGDADSYVWSSRPLEAAGPMTLWYVPAGAEGLAVTGGFDGLGLRGNGSAPMAARDVHVPAEAIIGADGAGLDLALAAVLPVFLVCNGAMSAGLMQRLAQETAGHLQRTRLTHLDQSLSQQQQPRQQLARLQIDADRAVALLDRTLSAVEEGRGDAQLLVLEIKAANGEAAAEAADLALRAGGGAAFRKESPVERLFRDSRAARVMAPTSDALQDFVGRALCGLPLLGDVA